MKKLLPALALIALMGAGCTGGSTSSTPGTSEKTTVAWVYYEDIDCEKLLVSPTAAKAIGYPNGDDDSICASAATESVLHGNDFTKTSGSENVILSNLVEADDHDNLWYVDVKLAE